MTPRGSGAATAPGVYVSWVAQPRRRAPWGEYGGLPAASKVVERQPCCLIRRIPKGQGWLLLHSWLVRARCVFSAWVCSWCRRCRLGRPVGPGAAATAAAGRRPVPRLTPLHVRQSWVASVEACRPAGRLGRSTGAASWHGTRSVSQGAVSHSHRCMEERHTQGTTHDRVSELLKVFCTLRTAAPFRNT